MNKTPADLYLRLCAHNREKIYNCEEESFRKYGQVIRLKQTEDLIRWSETVIEEDGPVYVPHYPSSSGFSWKKELEEELYGGLPLQAGSCCGMNNRMNGMEFHKGHEFILALTPLVLFVGHSRDLITKEGQWRWDSSWGRFYYVSQGTAVELYSTTMHLAPCRIGPESFKSLILLPEGTNLDLEKPASPDSLLFKKNKWMICHPESPAAGQGACPGIVGENRSIRSLEHL